MKKIFVSLSLLLSALASADTDPCENVRSVLKDKKYFENRQLDGNLLGYIMFETLPMIGQLMHYDQSGDPQVLAKKQYQIQTVRAAIINYNGTCAFVTQAITSRQPYGQEIQFVDENTLELIVQEGDTKTFFQPSTISPVTDTADMDKIQERFEGKILQ